MACGTSICSSASATGVGYSVFRRLTISGTCTSCRITGGTCISSTTSATARIELTGGFAKLSGGCSLPGWRPEDCNPRRRRGAGATWGDEMDSVQ